MISLGMNEWRFDISLISTYSLGTGYFKILAWTIFCVPIVSVVFYQNYLDVSWPSRFLHIHIYIYPCICTYVYIASEIVPISLADRRCFIIHVSDVNTLLCMYILRMWLKICSPPPLLFFDANMGFFLQKKKAIFEVDQK